MKYQSSKTNCSKIISKVKILKKWVKLQGQGHRVKINGIHGILMWNIKALALTVQKLLAGLNFQRGGHNDRITERQNYRMTDRTKPICPRSAISGA